MQRTRIKICGIREPEHAKAAADAGADYIGLVFVKKSPRYVTTAEAQAVAQTLPPGVEPVGLFVDTAAADIQRVAKAVGLKTIQLHGHEPITILDELNGLQVIRAKAFDLDYIEDLREWDKQPAVCGLLLDTPPTKTTGLTGGSGEAFDWNQLMKIPPPAFETPIFLAGGLTPDNVAYAMNSYYPIDVVDVSSGVESSRGVKDVGLIKAFCEAVRQADSRSD